MKLLVGILTFLGILGMMLSKNQNGTDDTVYFGLLTIMGLLSVIAQKLL